jgi:putative membrane protein
MTTQQPPNKVAEKPEDDARTALARERVNFAKFRTSLALDRTTLAWIRTALTFATFGFGMVGFFRAVEMATHSEQAMRLHQAAIHMGVSLIVIGLVATILAAFSHWMTLRRLRRGEQLSITQWPYLFQFLDSTRCGPCSLHEDHRYVVKILADFVW